jgi:segregation and condensation protein B
METSHSNSGAIEAVLFAHGEALPLERIAALLECTLEEVSSGLQELTKRYEESGSGLALIQHEGSAQLVTSPHYRSEIAALLTAELSQELGPAAQETLALIAYFGPLTRTTIDHVRGVSSALSLRTLLVRGLIERTKEGKGEAVYQVTAEYLKDMGIVSPEALPDYEQLRGLLERSLEARERSAEKSEDVSAHDET